mmetsp:Transcript_47804/g.124046  ORF Transcript_47804/g.124046 Transcript_47804/m.124046 type:complete len:263 (-) Transcript_47804:172-960(-)
MPASECDRPPYTYFVVTLVFEVSISTSPPSSFFRSSSSPCPLLLIPLLSDCPSTSSLACNMLPSEGEASSLPLFNPTSRRRNCEYTLDCALLLSAPTGVPLSRRIASVTASACIFFFTHKGFFGPGRIARLGNRDALRGGRRICTLSGCDGGSPSSSPSLTQPSSLDSTSNSTAPSSSSSSPPPSPPPRPNRLRKMRDGNSPTIRPALTKNKRPWCDNIVAWPSSSSSPSSPSPPASSLSSDPPSSKSARRCESGHMHARAR